MPVLNFREIAEANKSTGLQDTFELFARDFLEFLGFTIVQGPNRGQDGGKDIILKEIRKGIGGETEIKWLVSCKHKAHSGSSVGVSDEQDIPGRVLANKCHGFLGFYSTLPSSGLTSQLEGLKDRFEYQIYDREMIEKNILNSTEGLKLTKRFFPISISKWEKGHPKPEKFFWKYPELLCDYCGKNLLEPKKSGIVAIWEKLYDHRENIDHNEIVDIYCCCKGNCDRILKKQFYTKHKHTVDGWEDIPDICIPTIYCKWLVSTLHELKGKAKYSEQAFKKNLNILLAIFPYISRELTDKEKDTIKCLTRIPSYLGGLGVPDY